MKQRFIALFIALSVISPLFAQKNADDKPKAPPGTKIGVINLRQVYLEYVRVEELHKEIQSLEPYTRARKVAGLDVERTESGFFPTEPPLSKDAAREKQLELNKLEMELTHS